MGSYHNSVAPRIVTNSFVKCNAPLSHQARKENPKVILNVGGLKHEVSRLNVMFLSFSFYLSFSFPLLTAHSLVSSSDSFFPLLNNSFLSPFPFLNFSPFFLFFHSFLFSSLLSFFPYFLSLLSPLSFFLSFSPHLFRVFLSLCSIT